MRIFFLFFLMMPLTLGGIHFIFPPQLARFYDVSSVLYDDEGEFLHVQLNKDQKWQIPSCAEDVDPTFIKLLINTEDKRFFTHPGVDILSLMRAVVTAIISLRIHSGGSTLTMQVVRLLEPRPRTFFSKGIEILRAFQLEMLFSKNDILNIYLTLAPYGGNIQGIQSASLYYFGKNPKHLSLSEVAFLVALPQSPTKLSKNLSLQKIYRDKILQKSVFPGHLIKEACIDSLPKTRYFFPRLAPHMMAMCERGSKTHTTLLKNIQERLEIFLKKTPTGFKQSLAALISDKSGKIIAYAGSKDFFDADIHGQVDILKSVRSPGSTLKPFIYGLAFEGGWLHPKTVIKDTPLNFKGYTPTNFHDVFHGDVTVTEALQLSLNIPVVSILEHLGPRYFLHTLDEAGIPLHLPLGYTHISLPIALGGVGVRPIHLATLFNSLNNQGNITPLVWRKNSDFQKNSPSTPQKTLDEKQKSIFSPKSAQRILKILRDAPLPSTMAGGYFTQSKIAFKTGTSYGHRDAFAVGVDGEHTVLVWSGRADGAPVTGQTGLKTSAPLLLSIFKNILHSKGLPETWEHTLKNDPLPLHLAIFGKDKDTLPHIHFPHPGSILQHGSTHPFSFSGGVAPYTFFIGHERQSLENLKNLSAHLKPGFYDFCILDSQNNRTAVHFQVR